MPQPAEPKAGDSHEDDHWPVEALSLFELLVGAIVYLAAVGERFWIEEVRLANAYRLLGRELYAQPRYRACFVRLYGRLDRISQRLDGPVASSPAGGVKGSRLFILKTRTLAWLRRAAVTLWLRARRRGLFRRLGYSSMALDGGAGGSSALIELIQRHSRRSRLLRRRIARLSEKPPGALWSPRRLALAVAAVAAVLLLLLV